MRKIINTQADWTSAPFEQYLLVTCGGETIAHAIADDEPLDIEELLARIYPDCEIELADSCGGSEHAAIVTDGRPPNSPVVWTSSDFYLIFAGE